MTQKNIGVARFDDLGVIPFVLDDLEVLPQPLRDITTNGVRTGDRWTVRVDEMDPCHAFVLGSTRGQARGLGHPRFLPPKISVE